MPGLINLIPDFSLDNLANTIASATFDVINSGEVRTADMGGTCSLHLAVGTIVEHIIWLFPGAATTSEFTSAIIKKLA
jgi:isocitrate dehydrogenase (NAD+)